MTVRNGSVAFILASVFLLSIIAPAGAVSQPAGDKVDMLIGFHGSANPALVTRFGGEVNHQFSIINAVSARLPAHAAAALARHPAVKYVEPDAVVYAHNLAGTSTQTVPWGIDRVFGPESYPFPTWGTSTGTIAVAILDTGIDINHPDLNVVGGTTTVDDTFWGSDVSSHGTHVAGTVAALDNHLGVVGVAPSVQLYAVKVLSDSGSGSVSSVIAGIEWAVAQGIPIMNMSLGSSSHSQALQDACDAAYAQGHLLVASAGNSGNPPGRGDNVGYPGAYTSVIAVAASTSNDQRASWSSTGTAVELMAPGANILSTMPGDSYGTMSGTSMASPHVAGVAALVWAANTSLSNAAVRAILRDTAEDLGLSTSHQGSGLVRADLAVAAVDVAPPATGSLQGTVTDYADGLPISGAVVAVAGTDLTTNTDGAGMYQLENVPVGTYSVSVTANGYQSTQESVDVAEDQTVTLNFSLHPIPTYTVTGVVTDADTGDAIAGALVTIAGLSAVTGLDGSYVISGVESGTYTITASSDGYDSQTKTVTVDQDPTVVAFQLSVTPVVDDLTVVVSTDKTTYSWNSWMNITVAVYENGSPAAGAAVTVTITLADGSTWSDTGTTDGNGTASFRYRVRQRAPTGEYVVVATASYGGKTAEDSTTVVVQ